MPVPIPIRFCCPLWKRSGNPSILQSGSSVALAALLMFGIVRIIVKKTVKKLLDQPADSLFGLVLGVVISALLLAGWAYSGIYLEYSVLVRRFAAVLPAV